MIVASEEGMSAVRDRASRPGSQSPRAGRRCSGGGPPGKEAGRGGIIGRGEGAGGQGERFELIFTCCFPLVVFVEDVSCFFVILVHTAASSPSQARLWGAHPVRRGAVAERG